MDKVRERLIDINVGENAGPPLTKFQAQNAKEIRKAFPDYNGKFALETDAAAMQKILNLPVNRGHVSAFVRDVVIKDNSGTDFMPDARAYGELANALGKAASSGDASALATFNQLRGLAARVGSDGEPLNPAMFERMTAAFDAGKAGKPQGDEPEAPRGR